MSLLILIGHGNCDDYLNNGTPLPPGHPLIDPYLCKETIFSAGIILGMIVTLLFIIFSSWRCCRRWFKRINYNTPLPPVATSSLKEIPSIQCADDEGIEIPRLEFTSVSAQNEVENLPESVPSVVLSNVRKSQVLAEPPLPRRNRDLREMQNRHSAHKGEEIYNYGEYANMPVPLTQGRISLPSEIAVLPSGLEEKSHSLGNRLYVLFNETRIPHVEWSIGTLLIFIIYLGLNVLCLYVHSFYVKDFSLYSWYENGRSWGSLAAFNTMLLIIPATRNSILTLGLGLAFDHVVVYHRFLGRFTILCGLIHFYYFYDIYNFHTEPFVYATGVGAIACGLVIFASSLDYVRRNYFNVFYWSHYAFVGYLGLAYVHCASAKPFIMTGVAFYLLDKILRFLWQLWPRETVIFSPKGDSVAQVPL